MIRIGCPVTLVLALAVALATLQFAPQNARAAPRIATHAELELSAIGTLLAGSPPVLQWIASAHLDMRLSYDASALVFTLDPGVLVGATTQYAWGLTEAYWERRRPQLDLRFGVERIPLETARLTLPFSIEPVDILGTRLGRLGARLLWYPDQATRVRLALLEDGGRLLPAVSVRREFTSFEIEGHALAFGLGRTAYGMGASGLLGDLVVYGELWRLTAPSEARYAAGLSGGIKDGLWTLEAGYAAVLPGALPRLQLAGQVLRRFGEDLTVTGTAQVFFDPDAYRGQATVELSKIVGNATYGISLSALVGPEPTQGIITATYRLSF